jgi:hypothetical protein
MVDPFEENIPKAQSASSGGPPQPPKNTERGFEGEPPDRPDIEIPDPVKVEALAKKLEREPFIVIADLIELGQMKTVHDELEFATAATVVARYGFRAKKIG